MSGRRQLLLVLVLVALASGARARKCFRESAGQSSCEAKGSCGTARTEVGGLCGGGRACCLEGSDAECRERGGACVRDYDCGGGGAVSAPRLCPGSARVTCCLPPGSVPPAAAATASPPPHAAGVGTFERSVRNKISDLVDFVLNNATAPVPRQGGGCWPVARASGQKHTATAVSFGARRGGGYRCHAGTNLFTASPGRVVSAGDGVVVGIQPGFTRCAEGWGSPAPAGSDQDTSAVLVYDPREDRTVVYAEMDPGTLRVREGQRLRAGQAIGVASLCGMLHVQLYRGYVKRTRAWLVPRGQPPVPEGEACAGRAAEARPPALLDPTEFLRGLEGSWCDA